MQTQTHQEPLQAVRSPGGEVGPEAIASHVLHPLLIRQRRDSCGREFLGQLFIKKNEIGKSSPYGSVLALEGRKGCRSRDEVGHEGVFGAVILLDGRVDGAVEAFAAEVIGCRRMGNLCIDCVVRFLGFRDGTGCLVVDVFAPGDVGEVLAVGGVGRHREGLR